MVAKYTHRTDPGARPCGSVTTTTLFAEHITGRHARVVDEERRLLIVAGTPVATVGPDPSRITILHATSASGMSVVEILAAIAATDPTGVMVLETADRTHGFAFVLSHGRLTGARGPAQLDRVDRWIRAVHRRFPDRAHNSKHVPQQGSPAWLELAQEFLRERTLENLDRAHEPGSRLSMIRGDVEWRDIELDAAQGPSLEHILLEHARRCDETPKIMEQIGSLDRVAVPLAEPGEQPKKDSRVASSSEALDFLDDPDCAARAEWSDARSIWQLCDGKRKLSDVIDLGLLGRFRSICALDILLRQKLLQLSEAEDHDQWSGSADPEPDVIPLLRASAE